MSERWRIPNSKPWITYADRSAVVGLMTGIDGGLFGCGTEVAAFERELAEFLGRKYVVCVSSGTMALELAFRAKRIGDAGGGWIVDAFGFIATANAAERAMADSGGIAFVDSGEVKYHTSHILGELADPHPEDATDACQAFGAKLPPSLADCYSFNWNKPITCLGGGCVATDDYGLQDSIRILANQGRAMTSMARYGGNALHGVFAPSLCHALGTNARMSDMQAALGRSQLRRVGEILERRRQVAAWYWLHLPYLFRRGANQPESRDSWFLYPIELSNRDEVHAKMLERGIQTRSCADWLLPAHPFYAERYGYKRGDFPEAERRADRTLLLPLYPEMTLEQVREVCDALGECDARS